MGIEKIIMNNKTFNSEKEGLYRLIDTLVQFPFAQVCKHWAALQVVELLEVRGLAADKDLAKALCQSDDDTALELLKDRLRNL